MRRRCRVIEELAHGLRELTGNDEPVREYILKNPDALEFISKTEQLLSFCMPRYASEGKSYLTVGIGCTGGRHRSVVLTNVLSDSLRRKTGLPITVVHRDVARAGGAFPGKRFA